MHYVTCYVKIFDAALKNVGLDTIDCGKNLGIGLEKSLGLGHWLRRSVNIVCL